MFISQINRNLTFSEHQWLISLAPHKDSSVVIPGVTVLIEGVLSHRLFFGRYDLWAQNWEADRLSPPSNTMGYLKLVEGVNSDRYQGVLCFPELITYPTDLKNCAQFASRLEKARAYTEFKHNAVDVLPPTCLWVQKSCLSWCFDRLWETGVLVSAART